MTRGRKIFLRVQVAIFALGLAFAVVLIARDGGCDRSPPPDDDDMEPACKPGDKECHGAAPQDPPPA